jgi:hypothetical protein
MMVREITGIYCESKLKYINILCGKMQSSSMLQQVVHIITNRFQTVCTFEHLEILCPWKDDKFRGIRSVTVP